MSPRVRSLSWLVVGAAWWWAAPVRADDDDIIIIEDDPAPPPGKGGVDGGAPAGEDIIIIEDDTTAPAAPTGPPRPPLPFVDRLPPRPELPDAPFSIPEPPPLPLGDLPILPSPDSPTEGADEGLLGLRGDQVSLTGAFGFRTSVRPLGAVTDDLWRNLAHAAAAVDVRPDLPLRIHADMYVRARSAVGVRTLSLGNLGPADYLLPYRRVEPANRFSGVVEIGEFYAAAKLERVRVTVGRQLFAWTTSLTSPLASLLNPPDIRDGTALPDETIARSAVASFLAATALGPLGVQLVAQPFYAPARWPLYAEDSEAVDFNEPILPLVASRAAVGDDDLAARLQRQVPFADALVLGDFSPTVGARAFFNFWRADVTAAVVLGHDPLPGFSADNHVARALALASDRASASHVAAALRHGCTTSCDGVADSLRLRWRRTLVGHLEASMTVGPAVLRGAIFGSPHVGEMGRTLHIITRDGMLRDHAGWSAGGSLALESGYTELVQGFLEAGYEVLGTIPAGARVARYDAVDQAFPDPHLSMRPTLSARLQGVVLDDITWRLRATVAPWQRDAALVSRIGYRLSIRQEVAIGTEFFAGWRGTRGHFLAPQGRTYLEWGYRF